MRFSLWFLIKYSCISFLSRCIDSYLLCPTDQKRFLMSLLESRTFPETDTPETTAVLLDSKRCPLWARLPQGHDVWVPPSPHEQGGGPSGRLQAEWTWDLKKKKKCFLEHHCLRCLQSLCVPLWFVVLFFNICCLFICVQVCERVFWNVPCMVYM